VRADYERLILAGGFPMVPALRQAERGRWFTSFVDMVIDRDALEIRKVRQRHVLPLVLRHLAARTANVVGAADIARRLGPDFVAGVLIDLGQQPFRYDDRLFVMPADRLWSPPSSQAQAVGPAHHRPGG
jgi:predicted AAA+ superfamily ATPase